MGGHNLCVPAPVFWRLSGFLAHHSPVRWQEEGPLHGSLEASQVVHLPENHVTHFLYVEAA